MSLFRLTLDEVLESQDRLDLLCVDRPLRTREVFPPNAFYGIDRIIKEYAGISLGRSLKVVVPHGVCLNDEFLWEAERRVHLPAICAYPAYRTGIYERQTSKIVIESASPFVYLLELLRSQPRPARAGTIFFPCHSTRWLTVEMDFDGLADALASLNEEFQPVSVCIYWKDYMLGRHRPFRDRGLRVVSAGHMYDSAFLVRFYHLCSMHRYAASNELGSHLFYSVKGGCSFFLLDGFDFAHSGDSIALVRDVARSLPSRERELKHLFGAPQSKTTEAQMEMVNFYLGESARRSPIMLRRELLLAEKLDRLGFFVRDQARGRKLVLPPLYRRIPRRLLAHGRELFRSSVQPAVSG